MGEFLQNMIILDCDEAAAKAAIKKISQISDSSMLELIPDRCRFQEFPKGTSILLNHECCGYDPFTQQVSELTQKPVMLLYIYDGDFLGYFFYDKGEMLDYFMPMPDYFEESPEDDSREPGGQSSLIASYFHIEEESIKHYLVPWSIETMEDFEQKAYEEDECEIGSWQMTDFMKKLGFPYEWD